MSEEIKEIPLKERIEKLLESGWVNEFNYLESQLQEARTLVVILQQKVEQLESIRKEAIEFMKENCDIITIDKGWIIRSELTTTGLGKLFKILNKGE